MSREGFRPVHRVAAEVSECPEEVQEKLRVQLQGLGLSGEGDPCLWKGIRCWECKVSHIKSKKATGDLSSIKEMTDLKGLGLAGSQITGNVSELSKLKDLLNLDLSQTQVVGDVSVLTNMTELYDLSLAQSRVHGDFGVISSMPNLVKADLSGTAVSGKLKDLEPGCCKKLRELHLGVPASELQQCFFYVFVEKCGCTV